MAPTTRAQAQGTATPPVPLRLPPDSPRPPPADEWDDDDNDPLLDHVLRVLYPIQSMFARVRESLRHSGYFMFDHLYTLDKECVQELTYPNPDGPGRIPLPAGNRNHLLNIMQYKRYFELSYSRVMVDADWETFSGSDLKAFRESDGNISDRLGVQPAAVAPRSASSSYVPSRVDAFKKTIKRDPNAFQQFSDKRKWATWKLHFVATATAQDLEDVLDPAYVPSSPEDIAIFKLKNHFLYSVFVDKLVTDEGKTYVRHHSHDFDAQAIYTKMCAHYTVSRAAELSTGHVLKFLTNFQLGKDKWKGKTTVNFLAYYVEQLRVYDELSFNRVPPGPPLADDFKIISLDAAVQSIPDLRQVRITLGTLSQQTGKPATFSDYLTLLENAATSYDAQQQTASLRIGDDTRHVYMAQTDFFGDLHDDPGPWDPGFDQDAVGDPDDFDVDVPLSTVTAFAAQQRSRPRPPPRDPAANLPSHIYGQLTSADKGAWSKLSNDGRRLIVSNLASSAMGSGIGGLTSVDRRVHHTSWYDPGALPPPLPPPPPAPDNTQLLTMMTDQRPAHHPGDVRRLLSASAGTPTAVVPASTTATRNVSVHSVVAPPIGEDFDAPDGHRYRRINMSKTSSNTYSVANAKAVKKNGGALIDRGANGGLAGSDCRIIATSPDRFVNIEGIDRHQLTNIPIVTCGAYTVSRKHGPVILIFHQFAGMMRGPTIISSGQLEAHMNRVNDRSRKIDVNGQLITTNDGYEFPLHVRNGLPYLDLRPYTDREWDQYPHVVMTSDVDWDPSTIDGEFPLSGEEEFFDASAYDNGTNFDATGRYRRGTVVASARIVSDDPILTDTVLPDSMLVEYDFDHDDALSPDDNDGKPPALDTHDPRPPAEPPPASQVFLPNHDNAVPDDPPMVFKNISPHTAKSELDPEALRRFFAFLPADIVDRTLKITTQYARVPMSDVMKRFYKSPYPALNVARRNEDLLTDVIYSDTPAIDDGSTRAAVYSGRTSHVMDVYGMKTDKQFVNTLEDIIRDRGAPTRLLSDHAILIRSSRVLDILRALCIGQWTSEPHRQNQNTMERRYQTAKRLTNMAMDRSGCPPSCWLLCLQYVCLVLNCTACKSLNWSIPLTVLLGVTIDVSPLLRFHWFQPVFYSVDDASFPSEPKEALGYFVGIAPHCGHVMTFKVLCEATNRVLLRSQVRPADDPKRPNLRLTDLFDGEPPSRIFVRSKNDPDNDEELPNLDSDTGEIEQDVTPSMVYVDTSDLIGKTFLLAEQEDGTRHRARIVEMIQDHLVNSKEHVRFRLSVNNDQYEQIMAYGELLQHINKDDEQEVLWKYKRIMGHQGPLTADDEGYNGSIYNVQVEWENGEITYEPLSVIAADDPVSCAIYARDNGLLDTPGWKRFKRIAKNQKVFFRQVNQAKLRSFRTAPRFKYGFEIPKDYEHAKFLDRRNGNTKWQDATKLEFDQLDDYHTFDDLGHSKTVTPPAGYKKIRVHLVFDVKHDGRHKVRCVADGHLTDIPVDSVYSGVVSLRGLRMMLFLAELNQLDIWATDVGNAYLEAETKEKIYIIAGSEFGTREGHILVIKKALYGLRSSGLRWHERFSDCLRNEGFIPCKAEPDIWIRPAIDRSCYEMVAVYVDDLAIGMKDPEGFLKVLTDKYKFKLKGSGPITFHLGCDFERKDGILCMAPQQYIERMISQYERMFASKPRTNVTSPLEKNDHPEVDTSDFLDEEGIQQYQSLIGSLQWAVSLGRFDVTTAVMTLSSFRACPRKGHLDRAKRVVAYLYRFKFAKIRFRTHEPDYSDLVVPDYDWARSVYGDAKEDIPRDAPEPLGKPVVTTSYVDANLLHDLVTGRSITGILHFLNGTPIDWYSKKMATVETATYGAEFVSARTCVEQLVDLRNTLRYLGVPLREKSYIFGDNESVVNSSIQPHAKLHKRHNALSFHRVREAIATGRYVFSHIPGENNPADILSKHWGYSSVWHMLKVLLHVDGETINSPGKLDKDSEIGTR